MLGNINAKGKFKFKFKEFSCVLICGTFIFGWVDVVVAGGAFLQPCSCVQFLLNHGIRYSGLVCCGGGRWRLCHLFGLQLIDGHLQEGREEIKQAMALNLN